MIVKMGFVVFMMFSFFLGASIYSDLRTEQVSFSQYNVDLNGEQYIVFNFELNLDDYWGGLNEAKLVYDFEGEDYKTKPIEILKERRGGEILVMEAKAFHILEEREPVSNFSIRGIEYGNEFLSFSTRIQIENVPYLEIDFEDDGIFREISSSNFKMNYESNIEDMDKLTFEVNGKNLNFSENPKDFTLKIEGIENNNFSLQYNLIREGRVFREGTEKFEVNENVANIEYELNDEFSADEKISYVFEIETNDYTINEVFLSGNRNVEDMSKEILEISENKYKVIFTYDDKEIYETETFIFAWLRINDELSFKIDEMIYVDQSPYIDLEFWAGSHRGDRIIHLDGADPYFYMESEYEISKVNFSVVDRATRDLTKTFSVNQFEKYNDVYEMELPIDTNKEDVYIVLDSIEMDGRTIDVNEWLLLK